jgi:hypothetical protein
MSLTTHCHLLFSRAAQCFAGMKHHCRFARMVVMLSDRVHCIGGRSAALVDGSNGTVTDSTAIMPRYLGASGNCLERWCFLGRHYGFLRLISLARRRDLGDAIASTVADITPHMPLPMVQFRRLA